MVRHFQPCIHIFCSMLLTWSQTCLNESWVHWGREMRWSGVPDWKFGFTELKNSLRGWKLINEITPECVSAFWHKEVRAQVRIWIHFIYFVRLLLRVVFWFTIQKRYKRMTLLRTWSRWDLTLEPFGMTTMSKEL